jgi:hypothetical protein
MEMNNQDLITSMCAEYHGVLKNMKKEAPFSFETPIRIYKCHKKPSIFMKIESLSMP